MTKSVLYISERAIRAHYKCGRKAHFLIFSPDLSTPTAYDKMLTMLSSISRQNYFDTLMKQNKTIESFSSIAMSNGADILTNVNLCADLLSVSEVTLRKAPSVSQFEKTNYEPVIFSGTHKVQTEDKIELAFISYVLSIALNYLPPNGWVVLVDGTTKHVSLSDLITRYLPCINFLRECIIKSEDSPTIALNKHCPHCEFQNICKETATKQDSLTLLGGITQKEIEHLGKKGISTIKQLSFAYRPRKRGRRTRRERYVHKYELQALALRTGNIYIQDKLVEIPKGDGEIYIDFESIPEKNFFYLIGGVIVQSDQQTRFQFWANSINEEELIWRNFLSVIEENQNCLLLHYGSFESKAIEKLGERYNTPVKSILQRLFNVNSCIYGKIYFPVYSNSLKNICNFLGLSWSSSEASGLQSIVWRHNYDITKNDLYRQLLLSYNIEDCSNLKALTEHLREIIVNASHLPNIRFADIEGGSMPESASIVSIQLMNILHSAHGEYENKKIALKKKAKSKGIDSTCNNQKKRRSPTHRIINKIVRVRQGITCPKHPGRKLKHTNIEASQTIFDLIFTSRGVKKMVTRYIGVKGHCTACHDEYNPPAIRRLGKGRKYGHGFMAWAGYHRLALHLPYETISRLLEDNFGEPVHPSTIYDQIVQLSDLYIDTEFISLKRILSSPFIHIDETSINIGGFSQYVWVITDVKHVVFKLTDTREATIVHELLDGYTGVLCTDFYGGYDSVPCPQQKCWAHLIRDLNEDLRKNPFDLELEHFVCAVRDLIIPILEAVAMYGLKARHLCKFRKNVDIFYEDNINKKDYKTDMMRTYQKRFTKYQDKLFLFLDRDGIPWNNNMAERALRHLAVQRKISGSFGPQGAKKYLRLLGVTQTCRFQNKSLLQFLLSGEADVDRFKGSKNFTGWRTH